MRDSFVFYRSFFEAIKDLDDKKRLKMYDLILNFALNNEEIEQKNGICKQLFILIKPQLIASHKHFENGKKGGRPHKIKNPPFENEKTNVNDNVNVNVNDNVNDNVNGNVEVEETPATSKTDFLDLSQWRGEYSNVHLTDRQYADLVQYIGKKEIADDLIEELSANIAQKKENAPPYDDNFPDMHLSKLKAYWKFRKLKGSDKPQKQERTTAQIVEEVKKRMEAYDDT